MHRTDVGRAGGESEEHEGSTPRSVQLKSMHRKESNRSQQVEMSSWMEDVSVSMKCGK